jgi:UDP-2-acetamido-2,6-beta-L-arabino-hexul-4-ose reductase
MKILITGAKGFIGKNLVYNLKSRGYNEIFEFARNNTIDELERYINECDFIYHLAGVNRPENEEEYFKGNVQFTKMLLNFAKNTGRKIPILFSSSIHAEKGNEYGKSKKMAEDLVFQYSEETGASVYVFRLPNVFGKWSRPNYNSAIATFCYNITQDLPIQVNDPEVELSLVYVDDVVNEFINALNGNVKRNGIYCEVPIVYKKKLKEIVNLLYSFKNSEERIMVPNLSDDFIKKLYSTYLSFLPAERYYYLLKKHEDNRGFFAEFLKSEYSGQVSINVVKPGFTKGNHWHNTKVEKFLVVKGEGLIRLRKIDSDEIITYKVSDKELKVINIPPGFTHNIQNIGNEDMIVIIWANEIFDSDNPDTYYLEV